MESEGDEALNLNNHTKHMQDSMLTNSGVPQELLTEILVRFPVKYLLQFKCVSKEWLALISSPEFVKTHLTFSVKDHTRSRFLLNCPHHFKYCSASSLFDESVTEAFELDHPMENTNKPINISDSVNGLICLQNESGALVLWNPSIRKVKQVVHDFVPSQPYQMMYSFGFGYDEVHDDYRVVGIFSSGNGHVHAEVYSLKTDSWRNLDDYHEWPLYCASAKFVSGNLHWITCNAANGLGIMSIDLVDEKWGKVVQPSYGEGDFRLELGVLGSDLCLLYSFLIFENTRSHADVWIMKEYGVKESWTKLYSIRYPTDNISLPLCVSVKGEFLFAFDKKLGIYNAEDGSTRYPRVTNVDHSRNARLYIESLVCPIHKTNQGARKVNKNLLLLSHEATSTNAVLSTTIMNKHL